MKKVKVVSLACDTPASPPLHSYRIFLNYLKTVWELWLAQDFDFRGDNYITTIVRVVSLAYDIHLLVLFFYFHQILSKYIQGFFLIVLGFNDTSTLVGHFVSSPREREKRDRRDSRRDEREGQGRKRNRNESEETEEIKTSPPYPYLLKG